MSSFNKERREQSYRNLSHLFNTFRASLNPHIDVEALAELGVDVSVADLHEETARGGPYYMPISQSRLQSLDQRPEFDPGFSLDDDQWNSSDGCTLLRAFYEQMTESRDGSLFRAYEKTKWCLKWSELDIWFLATEVDVVSGVGRGAQLSEGSMKTGTVQLQIPLDSLTGR